MDTKMINDLTGIFAVARTNPDLHVRVILKSGIYLPPAPLSHVNVEKHTITIEGYVVDVVRIADIKQVTFIPVSPEIRK